MQNQESFIYNLYMSKNIDVGMNTIFDHESIGKVPFRLFYQKSTPQNKLFLNDFERYSWTLSKNIHGVFFNLRGDYTDQDLTNGISTLSTQLNLPINRYNLRTIINYNLSSKININSADIALSYRERSHYYEIGWRQNYYGPNFSLVNNTYNLRYGLNTDQGDVSLGYTTDSNKNQNFNINYSFAIVPTRKGPEISKRNGNSGSILLHVFLDKNDNGVFDKNIDLPLEGVGFKNIDPKLKTDSDGKLLASQFTPGKVYSISLGDIGETESDVILASKQNDFRFATKTGSVLKIEVPIIEMSDIDGYLIDRNNKPINGIKVSLKDMSNNHLMTTKSEYDGYFLLHKIPQGTYQVVFDNAQLLDLNLSTIPTQTIQITSDSPVKTIDIPLL